MKQYFEKLADAIPGPLMIYNMPATTHMSIPLEVIDQLSRHERIAGIKDSERNEARLKDSIALWKMRDDFSHFLGWAAKSAEALILGSDGLVPSTGNLHPQLYQTMLHAVLNNRPEEARRLQVHSDLLGDLYQSGRTLGESLAALKVLMNDAGLCQSYMMPPLCKLEEAPTTELKRNFRQLLEKERITLKMLTNA
jgi:dihydrodipicolinate synthase/N-acetylneuraminate lyase